MKIVRFLNSIAHAVAVMIGIAINITIFVFFPNALSLPYSNALSILSGIIGTLPIYLLVSHPRIGEFIRSLSPDKEAPFVAVCAVGLLMQSIFIPFSFIGNVIMTMLILWINYVHKTYR